MNSETKKNDNNNLKNKFLSKIVGKEIVDIWCEKSVWGDHCGIDKGGLLRKNLQMENDNDIFILLEGNVILIIQSVDDWVSIEIEDDPKVVNEYLGDEK